MADLFERVKKHFSIQIAGYLGCDEQVAIFTPLTTELVDASQKHAHHTTKARGDRSRKTFTQR